MSNEDLHEIVARKPQSHSISRRIAERVLRKPSYGLDTDAETGYTIGRKDGITKMANVKTAVSLRKDLFEQVEALANEMKISRSRLFVLALEEFLRRHQNQQLLEQINAAYDETPDPSEQALRRRMRRQHRQIVEGEW